ncbi:MAG: cysteine hydrolase family protein [Anaerolineae bacterium]
MVYPQFYESQRVGKLYAPDTAHAVEAGRTAGVASAATDVQRIVLLLVDAQVDFIPEDGSVSVPGAVADTRRTIEWIFRNVDRLTTIAASLDSHVPLQIFSPPWWINRQGEHPAPYTVIRSEDVKAGLWTPLYQPGWSSEYVEKLEETSRKELMIWPYHTLIGTPGHSITPPLYEAIAYHAAARQTQPTFLSKGSIPETEHYSILEPEVKVPGQPLGGLNTAFLNMLASYDVIYIAGQAKSHCVLESVRSMMRYFQHHTDFIRKLHLLMDCTSSVAHPTIDFDRMANETLERYAGFGLQLVTSEDPLP